jgi:acetyl-CoA carboxylase alpha subunit
VDRLRELSRVNPETLVRQRLEKFRRMGAFRDELAAVNA